jgi:hypothetical protein
VSDIQTYPGRAGGLSAHACRISRSLQQVDRAPDSSAAAVQHVGVDHGGLHAPVPQKLLHRPNVIPVHEKVSREGVPQGVHRRRLPDLRQLHRLPKSSLDPALMQSPIDAGPARCRSASWSRRRLTAGLPAAARSGPRCVEPRSYRRKSRLGVRPPRNHLAPPPPPGASRVCQPKSRPQPNSPAGGTSPRRSIGRTLPIRSTT